jgi:hypothetical protein
VGNISAAFLDQWIATRQRDRVQDEENASASIVHREMRKRSATREGACRHQLVGKLVQKVVNDNLQKAKHFAAQNARGRSSKTACLFR